MLCTYDVNIVEIDANNYETFYKLSIEKIQENLGKK